MCGINGRFNTDGRPVSEAEILAMRDVMEHRGPDDSGLFRDGAIGLGHRRLSIIDVGGGQQPIDNEDGSIVVVFNGEIYNFAELRRELSAKGHTFKTHTDTEVIVHEYEERGVDCVKSFRGMFAFALWDSRRRQLLLARDRLGIKPLYHAMVGDSLLFASEIKGLLQAEGLSAEIDPVGLRRYLAYRHVYGANTLFKGIEELAPGTLLIATPRGREIRRYWDVPPRIEAGEVEKPESRMLALLRESVTLRLISDVPLGAFLSGGVDSSVLTMLMAEQTDKVRTFSIGFIPNEESELHWARKVSELCGSEHHEFVQGGEDFFTLLRRLIWHHDEPLTFSASIPLYLLSRESKRVATVMLAGEGADELLAGYDNNVRGHQLARAASLLPAPLRRGLAGLPLPARLAAIADRISCNDLERMLSLFRIPDAAGLVGGCRVPLPDGAADDHALLAELGVTGRKGSFLDKLLYFQLRTYLLALLMKQDKMSMAASIETRVPYLDHHVVELAFSLPDRFKVRGRVGKYLLKRLARELLPREVVDRRKQGFPVPVAEWFRAPGNSFLEVLLDRTTLNDGFFEESFIRSRVERFRGGADISRELWSMLNLELWRREFFGPDAMSGPR